MRSAPCVGHLVTGRWCEMSIVNVKSSRCVASTVHYVLYGSGKQGRQRAAAKQHRAAALSVSVANGSTDPSEFVRMTQAHNDACSRKVDVGIGLHLSLAVERWRPIPTSSPSALTSSMCTVPKTPRGSATSLRCSRTGCTVLTISSLCIATLRGIIFTLTLSSLTTTI